MIHAPGIYFGMTNEEYQADESLGSGDHKALLANPVQWQFKRLRELRDTLGIGETELERKRKDEGAVGKAFGDVIHTALLEPDTFEDRYYVEPPVPAGYLDTIDDLKEALEPLGRVLHRAAKRIEYVMEARKLGLPLIEDWKAQQLMAAEGKQPLSPRWNATRLLIQRIVEQPSEHYGGKSQREAILTGGQPEVSIFWVQDGVPLKCRFDYLRIKAVIDAKTYAAREGEPSLASFLSAVKRYAYDLQAAHYLEGRAQIAAAVAEERVFGEHDPAWLAKVAAFPAENVTWTWLAVQTVGMPEIDVLEFRASMLLDAAGVQLREARREYQAHVETYGADEPWPAKRGVIVFDDQVFEAAYAMRGMMARGEKHWRLPE